MMHNTSADHYHESYPNTVQRILVQESWDKESAVLATRDLAAMAGFSNAEQIMLATVTSELATNILRYAVKGELVIQILRKEGCTGIEIHAIDQGPGIADVDLMMQEHATTTHGSLGLGLPSVKRNMDEFTIVTAPRHGTDIVARKWKQHA